MIDIVPMAECGSLQYMPTGDSALLCDIAYIEHLRVPCHCCRCFSARLTFNVRLIWIQTDDLYTKDVM